MTDEEFQEQFCLFFCSHRDKPLANIMCAEVCHPPEKSRLPVSRPIIQLSTRPGDRCHLSCESDLALTCDQYGNLYQNACVFTTEQCRNPSLQKAQSCGRDDDGMLIIPTEPAPPNVAPKQKCERGCGQEYQPVCDTRGATFINACAYDQFKCMYPTAKTKKVPCSLIESEPATGGCKSDADCRVKPYTRCNTASGVCVAPGP